MAPRDLSEGLSLRQVRNAALQQLELVADGDLAARDDAGEHPALAVQPRAEPVAKLVHAVTGIADHRDLELGLAGAHPLSDLPLLHVRALDRDVLADRAGLDVDRVEMLLRDEQDLALGRVRMRAALEPLPGDRTSALVADRATALARRRSPEADDRRHRLRV